MSCKKKLINVEDLRDIGKNLAQMGSDFSNTKEFSNEVIKSENIDLLCDEILATLMRVGDDIDRKLTSINCDAYCNENNSFFCESSVDSVIYNNNEKSNIIL